MPMLTAKRVNQVKIYFSSGKKFSVNDIKLCLKCAITLLAGVNIRSIFARTNNLAHNSVSWHVLPTVVAG